MISIYELKPRFQSLLRPWVKSLAKSGVQANHVTLLALFISLFLGAFLYCFPTPKAFFLLPLWMFLRMALNAIDGMLAREFNQQSSLGAYLNELSDVISDAVLLLPFSLLLPFDLSSIFAVIFVATLSEMSGVLALMVGAKRQYQGPMGKSDRAFLFGALGLYFACFGAFPAWVFWLIPICILLMCCNILKRIQSGIKERLA